MTTTAQWPCKPLLPSTRFREQIAYIFPPNIGHAYITYEKENHMIYGTSGYYDKKEELSSAISGSP